MRKVSIVTGQTVRDTMILRKAFADAGDVPLEGNLIRMQAALGGVNEEGLPTAHIFTQLGLSIANLQKMSPEKQVEAILGAVNKLGNQSSKMAAIRGIFGRGGADMLAIDPKQFVIGLIYSANSFTFLNAGLKYPGSRYA